SSQPAAVVPPPRSAATPYPSPGDHESQLREGAPRLPTARDSRRCTAARRACSRDLAIWFGGRDFAAAMRCSLRVRPRPRGVDNTPEATTYEEKPGNLQVCIPVCRLSCHAGKLPFTGLDPIYACVCCAAHVDVFASGWWRG